VPQGTAAAMMQAMDRALGSAHLIGDLHWREAHDVAKNHDCALVVREGRESRSH
jgi:hypothetical protein